MAPINPIYVMENDEVYEMTTLEARRLEEMGFIFFSDESGDERRAEIPAFVWDDLGIDGDRVFLLFDVILGRKKGGD